MSETPLTRDSLLGAARRLPSSPAVLAQLQRLLGDANSGLDDICTLLKRDMALSARIIQVSNSPFFGSGNAHASLEEAVGCVGYDEVYKLVGLTLGAQLFNRDLSLYRCSAVALWENTLACALAVESLAQFAGLNPRGAYTAGLMRSMGKIVLEQAAAGRPGLPALPAGSPTLHEWEEKAFGWESLAVTEILLAEWNFPPEIGGAVRRHCRPAGPPAAEPLGWILNLAGGIARELGRGLPGEDGYWDGAAAAEAVGLSEAEIDLSLNETRHSFDEVRSVFVEPGAAASAAK